MTVLIIEDDKGLRTGISFSLSQDGYEVAEAGTAREGYAEFLKHRPDLILLDLNLPDQDGVQLCRKIRKKEPVPILMLTARDMETDELLGLSSGADDYMTKPFSIAVLKLCIAKLLERKERADGAGETQILRSGPISIHTGLIKVWEGEEELECSVTEYKLLKFFLDHPGQVLTRNQILDAVWDSRGKYVSENTLQVNIGRLRKKLDKENPDRFIKTIHGIGYLWEEEG